MTEPKDDGSPTWTRDAAAKLEIHSVGYDASASIETQLQQAMPIHPWPEANNITFANQSKKILVIDSEGKLIPGEGLSMDEVTQGVFEALAKSLPKYAEISELRARLAEERERCAKIAERLVGQAGGVAAAIRANETSETPTQTKLSS